jgi:hypothetical protein
LARDYSYLSDGPCDWFQPNADGVVNQEPLQIDLTESAAALVSDSVVVAAVVSELVSAACAEAQIDCQLVS